MTFDLTRLGAWQDLPFFANNLPDITQRLNAENRQVLPERSQVFAALELTQPNECRVVILGQDPYPTPGHPHGLAFSAEAHVCPLPRSLANIFCEMQDDIRARPPNADLRFWARQGVLMLNTILTVPAGEAKGHANIGWQVLAREVLTWLDAEPRAFLLWGRTAQQAAAPVQNAHHLKIETSHPSPRSACLGFFESRPFSRVNTWLERQGGAPINWTDPEAE